MSSACLDTTTRRPVRLHVPRQVLLNHLDLQGSTRLVSGFDSQGLLWNEFEADPDPDAEPGQCLICRLPLTTGGWHCPDLNQAVCQSHIIFVLEQGA